jgi:hypothetical protein
VAYDMVNKFCDKNRIEFLDLTKPMKQDFEKHNTMFNSELDFHWDEYGHRFVSNVLYEYLKKTE